ncbi:DHA2 family efflux MFS transporter permease subunit [Microbacterium sp. YMB-B2]|uniref:DHA2 family efflux MFS transporter permease subunit n=1 Tax=Microbacterium tenebrionis TaxID=2830665 RepID=A0A9X1LNH0_9MICO|nr:DHA2 family efflux MFS transporter permease subunit [Microbacterium tenebrionis]
MSVDSTVEPSTGSIPVPGRDADRLPPGAGIVIGLLVVSAFVVILNETIMGVALPQLMIELDVTTSTAQWLTTGFMLTMAVVIPTTGVLLQRFATRAVFIAAMTLFSAGTLIAAVAPGFEVLLIGRVVQAAGTAIMMPLLMTTVMNVVPARRLGQMMGVISIVIAVAPAIGPTVSGVILSLLDWRWMFLVVLPIALIGLGLGAWKITNLTETRMARIDALSVILSTIAFGGMIYGLSSLGEAAEGGAVIPPWVSILVGAVALVLFVLRQLRLQRTDDALLDLRTFTRLPFAVAIILVGIAMMALFGSLIVLPLYMQNVLQIGALETGLLLLPGGALMGIASPIVGRLYDRYGPRPLVIPGVLVVSVSVWGMALLLQEGSSTAWVIITNSFLNLGLAFTMTPLLTNGLGSLGKKLYSHGSATISTVQQLAGAIGTALFVTVLSTGTAAGLAEGLPATSATAGGVQAAFFCGAWISLAAVIVSFFVKKVDGSAPSGAVLH